MRALVDEFERGELLSIVKLMFGVVEHMFHYRQKYGCA